MYKILKTTKIFEHPRITLFEDDIELPDGTKSKYLKFENKANGSDILAIRDDGKILLQKEYSHPVGEYLWQFTGGFIDKDETHEHAAIRELSEETGYKPTNIKTIGKYYTYRRRISEIVYVHIATGLEKVKEKREASEIGMTYEWFTEDEIDKMIINGEITVVTALAVWALYKASKSKLIR